METEGRVCGRGRGPGAERVRGERPACGVPARPAAPQHLCIVHCAVRAAAGGRGGRESGRWVWGGQGLPRGRGLADTTAGVPARALGDAEHRRDNLVAREGAPARTEGGRPPRQPRRLTAAGPALPAMSLPAAAPTPSRLSLE